MANDLKAVKLGLAIGITAAIYALFLGWVGGLFSWGVPLVEVMSAYYIGFAPTFFGGILGAIWLFIDGFIAGLLIAVFYNKFS